MPERLKVKFMMVIWGARYISEFARVSLPSYLAEGNLPYLAENTDFEILVLTTEESRYQFDLEPVFVRLHQLATVRFLYIDDLVTSGNYGVTLTLAYARGILDSGDEQTNTCFVFMNSDFVLADGSLRTLVKTLEAGHRCVMAPSLRASSETTIEALAEAADPETGIVTMAPRDMVRLTFDNLHPTVIGKTVTQELITCATHNQLYWQVDENTLLARHYLIFMLAIRPEVPMPPINSYCDYGFVPELVPSGKFTVLDNSDDFFMLELQSAAQEQNLLYGGRATPDEIAAGLSVWTTKEHRAFAEHPIVFRAGEPVADVEAAQTEFARFHETVRARLRKTPLDHVDHFYWVLGLKAWASLRGGDSFYGSDLPPELGVKGSIEDYMANREDLAHRQAEESTPGLGAAVRRTLRAIYLRVLGRVHARASRRPDVPIWHYLWLDYRLIYRWLEEQGPRGGERALFICDSASDLAPFFSKQPGFKVKRLREVFGRGPATAGGVEPARAEEKQEERFDSILLHIYRAHVRETQRIVAAAQRYAKPGAKVSIFLEHVRGESDPSNFSRELAQYVGEVMPRNWIGYRVSARFAGGRMRRRLRVAEKRLVNYLFSSSLIHLPVMIGAAILWPFVGGMTAINNLRQRNRSEVCPPYCSSVLVTFSRTARAGEAAATAGLPGVAKTATMRAASTQPVPESAQFRQVH